MTQYIQGPTWRWGQIYRPFDYRTSEDGPHEAQIAEMCDYGAAAVARGECDAVQFECCNHEITPIKAYMAEHHPSVKFYCMGGPP